MDIKRERTLKEFIEYCKLIASRLPSVGGAGQFHVDRDACKGSTGTPQRGNSGNDGDPRTSEALAEQSMSAASLF